MSGEKDFKAHYECSQGISGQNGGIYNSPEASMMTEPKLTGRNLTNSRTEMRKSMVSQLTNLMSSEEQTWRLPDAVHAVVAALFVLYDQDLVAMELRKILSFSTGPSGK